MATGNFSRLQIKKILLYTTGTGVVGYAGYRLINQVFFLVCLFIYLFVENLFISSLERCCCRYTAK